LTNSLNSAEQRIKTIESICKAANQAYLTYLQKFASELINADNKQETLNRQTDLGLQIIIKKILHKDYSKESKQLREPTPKLYPIPTSLDAIYGAIERILAKRGFTKQ